MSDGSLAGFAAWQQVFTVLDVATHPDAQAGGFDDEIVTWAIECFARLGRERRHRLPYWIGVRDDQPERAALAERHGFVRREWTMIQLSRSLDAPIPDAALPDGFRVRPLAGTTEIAAYVATHQAAFESEAMTVDWRRRVLASPAYQSDLDLIAEAPDGRLVAFAIGWLGSRADGSTVSQFEPVGTHPDFQRRGLARALLVEGLHRMRAHGAVEALVETDLSRVAARQLYESVGFRVEHRIWMYAREF
ncbi:MAG: GNAT family N-acetyltransferase [Chloroflexota bacterium]